MSTLVLLLTFGLVARVTRLITDDRVLGRVRAAIIRRFGPNHPIAYWVACPWCVSPYVAAALVTIAWHYGHTQAYLIAAAIGTASWITGAAATFVDGGDR